jgi:trigger factor
VKVTTEKPEAGMATLTVEVPPEEFDRAIDQAWRRIANRVNIPGFRRGKAPRALVERQVGPAAVDEEALRRLQPERYDAAVDEAVIVPLERPQFDLVQAERGKPVVFKATVAVRPVVDLGDYTALSIKPDVAELREDEVQRVLDRLRESQAQWIPVEDRGLEMGDQAIADLKIDFAASGDIPARTSDRKDAEIILGENGYPEGFDQQLVGAKPGDTREFTLSWQMGPGPGEPGYEEGTEPEQRTASFVVAVKEIKRKQLPALDDDFAKALGEHDTIGALTEDVRARLREEALRSARVATENKAVDAAVEAASIEMADRLVDMETEALVQERRNALAQQRLTLERYLQMMGQDEAAWRQEQREQALRQLKARLVLDAVGEKESLAVEPEAIEQEIETAAQGYGAQANQARRQLSTPESRRRIETGLRRRKAIEKLVEHAGGYPTDVVDVPAGSPTEDRVEDRAEGPAGSTDGAAEGPEGKGAVAAAAVEAGRGAGGGDEAEQSAQPVAPTSSPAQG